MDAQEAPKLQQELQLLKDRLAEKNQTIGALTQTIDLLDARLSSQLRAASTCDPQASTPVPDAEAAPPSKTGTRRSTSLEPSGMGRTGAAASARGRCLEEPEHDREEYTCGLYHNLVLRERPVSPRWSSGPEDDADLDSVVLLSGLCADCQPTYSALLKRGVTIRMIEKYRLEGSDALGIVAWVDEELFEEFRLRAMEGGDRWKIYLGRRIRFAPESNSDGRGLMRSLLENLQDSELWTTFKEGANLWTTGPAESSSIVPDWVKLSELDDGSEEEYEMDDGKTESSIATEDVIESDGNERLGDGDCSAGHKERKLRVGRAKVGRTKSARWRREG